MLAYVVVSGIATFVAVLVWLAIGTAEGSNPVAPIWPVMIALSVFFVGLAIVTIIEGKSED